MMHKKSILLAFLVLSVYPFAAAFTGLNSVPKPNFAYYSSNKYDLLPAGRIITPFKSSFSQLNGSNRNGAASSREEDLKRTIEIIKMGQAEESKGVKSAEGVSSETSLDQVLSTFTTGFPFFVLFSAILGMLKPKTLTWVNNGEIIPLMLAAVMTAMGMTLRKEDFTRVFSVSKPSNNFQSSDLSAIPAGLLCQYLIMPCAAFTIGSLLLLPDHPFAFLGLLLVGCSPGGTASNLVALIAKADVALSVVLTSLSTIMASVLTPLLVKTLAGSNISVSGWLLCKTTARVVLLPVALGMVVREKLPKLANFVSRFAPFTGVLLVSLLCGGVVAQNSALALSGGCGNGILLKIIACVFGLHSLGFGVGYLASKRLFGLQENVARTIAIETGMQNSALAVVLARSVVGADTTSALISTACLPGAFSATVHSCLGSALAVYWRWRDCKS